MTFDIPSPPPSLICLCVLEVSPGWLGKFFSYLLPYLPLWSFMILSSDDFFSWLLNTGLFSRVSASALRFFLCSFFLVVCLPRWFQWCPSQWLLKPCLQDRSLELTLSVHFLMSAQHVWPTAQIQLVETTQGSLAPGFPTFLSDLVTDIQNLGVCLVGWVMTHILDPHFPYLLYGDGNALSTSLRWLNETRFMEMYSELWKRTQRNSIIIVLSSLDFHGSL